MIGFLPLIGLFANIITSAVGASGVISAGTSKLIQDLISGVLPMVGTLTHPNTKTTDFLAVLAGLSAIITALKADTLLPSDKLQQLNLLDGEIQVAIQAYVKAGAGFNPANYQPIVAVI